MRLLRLIGKKFLQKENRPGDNLKKGREYAWYPNCLLGDTGPCCVGADDECVIVTQPQCNELGGFFRFDKTECEEGLCDYLGACCIPDEDIPYRSTCHEGYRSCDCADAGGFFLGTGARCDDDPDDLPHGGCVYNFDPCCLCDGACIEQVSGVDCILVGGRPGVGSCQSDGTCDPFGACCVLHGEPDIPEFFSCFCDTTQHECETIWNGPFNAYLGDCTHCLEACGSNPGWVYGCPTDYGSIGACCTGGLFGCFNTTWFHCNQVGGVSSVGSGNAYCDPSGACPGCLGACCCDGFPCEVTNSFNCNEMEDCILADICSYLPARPCSDCP